MQSFISKPLLICYLILASLLPLHTSGTVFHPFHISSTDVNYNTKTSTLEISCRIFTDDFELALANNFKVKSDLSSEAKHKAMDVLVKKYVLSKLSFKTNDKTLVLNYLGFEKDNEATIVYLESEPVKGLKKLETINGVLYDQFDDQANIVHVSAYGKRKSAKVDYPNKSMVSEL